MKFNFNFKDLKNINPKPEFKRSLTPNFKPLIISFVLGMILILGVVYVVHPPFNWHSVHFYFYLVAIGVFLSWLLGTAYFNSVIGGNTYAKLQKLGIFAILAVVAFMFITSFIASPFFIADQYHKRIDVQSVNFTEIEEVDFKTTPIIDRISTEALGDRVMGQMPELVSQFEVSDDYTQISYKNSVYRVTPLEYADTLKYFINRSEGIPAYITVNSTTGEAELVKLKDLGLDGMRYVPSAMLNENLMRKLQLDYPTKIFGSPSFEIDEAGHPWYVCTTYTYKGVETMRKVEGVVLFDPITGDSTYFDNVLDAPSWVDRVYPESLIIEEVDNYGLYQEGFLNSIFGQKNVFMTSEGYNYLEKDGDIWIYSGLTSVNSDSSNLGFVLVNLRTHEAMKIASAGADEYSAMNSAEGQVKNYGYNATFPLLVNVNGRPVYLMSLKDDVGLIKMYAMVDATDYQKVVTVTVDEGLETLKAKFMGSEVNIYDEDTLSEATITIRNIRFLISEGTSKVFITATNGEQFKLIVDGGNEDKVAFLESGDSITIKYYDGDINIIKELY